MAVLASVGGHLVLSIGVASVFVYDFQQADDIVEPMIDLLQKRPPPPT